MQRKVYLLHGWSIAKNTPEKWQPLQQALAERGVESELLRIPGLTASLDEVWELENYVQWLKQELDRRDANEVLLLGHSFGGQIATQFAATHPQLISRLILIDAAGIRDHSFLPTVKREVFRIVAKIGKVFFQWDWARKLLYLLAREQDYKNAPPLLRRTMSNILDAELHEMYPAVTVPTLLIWGEADSITPLWMGEYMQRHIPEARLEIISDARHSPQYTHVEETADLIYNFLHVNNQESSS